MARYVIEVGHCEIVISCYSLLQLSEVGQNSWCIHLAIVVAWELKKSLGTNLVV